MAQLVTDYTVNIIKMCDMYGIDRNSTIRQAADMFSIIAEHGNFDQFRLE